MAILGDKVIQILRPPPDADQHEVGIAPILLGQVISAGTGAPGTDWNVKWSNGSISLDHDNTVLRVVTATVSSQDVGRRARPISSINAIAPEGIGIIRMRDQNDLYILEMPDGTLYSLSAANLQLLDS